MEYFNIGTAILIGIVLALYKERKFLLRLDSFNNILSKYKELNRRLKVINSRYRCECGERYSCCYTFKITGNGVVSVKLENLLSCGKVRKEITRIQQEVKICLETDKPVDHPTVITCRCKNCWDYLCDLEAGAICEHGFLAGCHTRGAKT